MFLIRKSFSIYFEQDNANDERLLSLLCKCFGLFHAKGHSVRGTHRGLIRYNNAAHVLSFLPPILLQFPCALISYYILLTLLSWTCFLWVYESRYLYSTYEKFARALLIGPSAILFSSIQVNSMFIY